MKGMKKIRLVLSIVLSAVLAFPNVALAAPVDNAGVPQLLSDELSSGEYSVDYSSEVEEFKVDGTSAETGGVKTFSPDQELVFSWVNSYYRNGDTPIVEIQILDDQGQTSTETNVGDDASISLSCDEGVYSFSYEPDSTVESFRVKVWASYYDWFEYDHENECCIFILSAGNFSITLFDDILTQQEKDDGYPKIVTNAFGDKKVIYPNRTEILRGTIGIHINNISELDVLYVDDNSYSLEDLAEYYDETSDSYLIQLSGIQSDVYINAEFKEVIPDEYAGLFKASYSVYYDEEIEEWSGVVKANGNTINDEFKTAFTAGEEIEFTMYPPCDYDEIPLVYINVRGKDGNHTTLSSESGGEITVEDKGDHYSFKYTPDSLVSHFSVDVLWSEFEAFDWYTTEDVIFIISKEGLSVTLYDSLLTQDQKDDGYPKRVENSKYIKYAYPIEYRYEDIEISIDEDAVYSHLLLNSIELSADELVSDYGLSEGKCTITPTVEMYGCGGENRSIQIALYDDGSGESGGESGGESDVPDEYAGLFKSSYSVYYDEEIEEWSGVVKANGNPINDEFKTAFTAGEEIEFTMYPPIDYDEIPLVYINVRGKNGNHTTLSSESGGEITVEDKGDHYSFKYTPDSLVSHFSVDVLWSEFEAFDWYTTEDVIFIISKEGLSVTLYDSLLTQDQKDDGYPKRVENSKYIKYAYPIEYRYEDIEISIDEDAVYSHLLLNSIELSADELVSDYGLSGGKCTITPTVEMYGCGGENRSIQIALYCNEGEEDPDLSEGKFDIYTYTALSGCNFSLEGTVVYNGDTVESGTTYEFTADERISLKLTPPENRTKETPYVFVGETLFDESHRYCFSADADCHTEFELKKEGSDYILNYLPTDDIKYFDIHIYWSRYDSTYVDPDEDISIEIISEGVNTTLYNELLSDDEKEDYPRSVTNAYGEKKYVYPNRLKYEPIIFTLESGYELEWVCSSGSYLSMNGEEYMALHGLGDRTFEIVPTQEMYDDSTLDNRLVLFITTHKHTVVTDRAVAATCTTNGKTEGSHCSSCGKVLKAQTTIKATGHTAKENKQVKATTKADGVKAYYSCTKCKQNFEDKACKKSIGDSKALAAWKKKAGLIPRAYVIFETTTVTYTGKEIKPAVKIVDGNGKAIAKTNYTVAYKNNKNVGQASVTVTFKGDYSGSTTLKFNICQKLPTAVKGLKATSGKAKEVTVTWKKADNTVKGFEIQYSLDKNFVSGVKTVKAKSTATSASIKKLTSKKTYYVRMRSTGKDGKTTTYSAWSKAVTVKVK